MNPAFTSVSDPSFDDSIIAILPKLTNPTNPPDSPGICLGVMEALELL